MLLIHRAFYPPQLIRLIECIILGKDTFTLSLQPPQDHAAERHDKETDCVPAHEGEQRILPSARVPQEKSDGSPTQVKRMITRAPKVIGTSEGCRAEAFVRCLESMTPPGETLPLPTHPQHPIEHPTLVTMIVTPLDRTSSSRSIANSDVYRTVGERFRAGSFTEFVIQPDWSFTSSEMCMQGDDCDETGCEGIEAEDWLDVTKAMLAIGPSGL